MTNYLIIHGAYGNPNENWFPWLSSKLEKIGAASVPQFPTPDGQNLSAWMDVGKASLGAWPTAETVLIGHSTVAILALRMAERSSTPLKAIFCVCPFARDLGNKFDALNESFVRPPFDWAKIESGAGRIMLVAGDNDPYVPLSYSRESGRNETWLPCGVE